VLFSKAIVRFNVYQVFSLLNYNAPIPLLIIAFSKLSLDLSSRAVFTSLYKIAFVSMKCIY
jgi:hypothetical protein